MLAATSRPCSGPLTPPGIPITFLSRRPHVSWNVSRKYLFATRAPASHPLVSRAPGAPLCAARSAPPTRPTVSWQCSTAGARALLASLPAAPCGAPSRAPRFVGAAIDRARCAGPALCCQPHNWHHALLHARAQSAPRVPQACACARAHVPLVQPTWAHGARPRLELWPHQAGHRYAAAFVGCARREMRE